MEKSKFLPKEKISLLPQTTGVYFFYDKEGLLYIGKAINIQKRVKNHFQSPSAQDEFFADKVWRIGFLETDSEIEALILEAKLIKEKQPKYNVIWKDGKEYFWIATAKNDNGTFRVFVTHQHRKIRNPKSKTRNKFQFQNSKSQTEFVGPFIDGKALKQTLKILRKIFPFYSVRKHGNKPCLWCHLGLCPGPSPDVKECRDNIKNLTAFLKGQKKSVLRNMDKEMKLASQNQDYEKAGKIRDKISALEKILAHAHIFKTETDLKDNWQKNQDILQKIAGAKEFISRIEAYDIANIQGKQATGSMVVFVNGKADKNLYRKFRIKILNTPNDIAMLKETISRRLNHSEWEYPGVMLIDGGKAQLNVAMKAKSEKLKTKNIKVLAIAKKNNKLYIEGKKNPVLLKTLPQEIYNLILQMRDEAHRFARVYHHKLRAIDAGLKR